MRLLKPLKSGVYLALCIGLMGATLNLGASAETAQCPAGINSSGMSNVSTNASTGTNITDTAGISLAAQGVTPAIEGRVINVDVIDNDSLGFTQRIVNQVVRRPAPQPGMTRSAVEALWGPSLTSSLAPGKDTSIYVNNRELIDGRVMNRVIGQGNLKVYEVTYSDSTSPLPSGEAKVLTVQPVMMPRVGDHINMYSLLLNSPIRYAGNMAFFSIPAARIPYYSPMISNASQLVKVNTDTQGVVVAQEFVSGDLTGSTYAFTSAERYAPTVQNFQSRY